MIENNRVATSGIASERTGAPDVTVIIAAYNAAHSISATISSVANIAQWPVVVVDDGSTDSTTDISRSLGVNVVVQENQGASRARSNGLSGVDTEFVIFLDSDDSLLPGVLRAVQQLRDNQDAGVVGGLITPNSGSNRGLLQPRRNLPAQLDTALLLRETFAPWPQSAAVWRRSALIAARESRPDPLHPRFAEDFELLIRVSLVAEVLSIPEPTCLHQLSGGKSARSAEEAVRQSERVRSYYSSFLGVQVHHLTVAGIEDQAAWRRFRASQSEHGLPLAIKLHAFGSGDLLRLVRHQLRRLWKRINPRD